MRRAFGRAMCRPTARVEPAVSPDRSAPKPRRSKRSGRIPVPTAGWTRGRVRPGTTGPTIAGRH